MDRESILPRVVSNPPSWQFAQAVRSEAEWTAIVQAALRHGVGGILCDALRRQYPGAVPDDILQAAGVFLANQRVKGDALLAELLRVLDALDVAGIRTIPFKGPLLAETLYGDRALRTSRDLDLLVDLADRDRAIAVLNDLGYRGQTRLRPHLLHRYYDTDGEEILFAKDRHPVEPHWAFAPATFVAELDMAGIWDRAVTVPFAGRAVLCLSPEDNLMALCLHGSKEKWWRLSCVVDVARFIGRNPELDWPAMLARAREAGVLRMVLLGLALARDVAQATLPPNVSARVDGDPVCLNLSKETRERLFDPDAEALSIFRLSIYHWRIHERFGDRLAYVWRTATTPRPIHYQMVDLPMPLSWGYRIVKVVHDYLLLPLWLLGKRLFGKVNRETGR